MQRKVKPGRRPCRAPYGAATRRRAVVALAIAGLSAPVTVFAVGGQAQAAPTTGQAAGAEGHAKADAKPRAARACPAGAGRVACVDLPRQVMWVQNGGRVIFGPVSIRTGRNGYETRPGSYRVYWRNLHHYSTLYNVAMPYSQFFNGGQAFHGVSIPLSTPPGSHGCVNMRNGDAARLWSILRLHDRVYVWGSRPGT